jgi:vitamin B12 transporter
MKVCLLAIILPFCTVCAYGRADTVDMREVTVQGLPPEDVVTTFVTKITRSELLLLQPLQITDALRTVPGLFIRDYGGVGGVKSVSLRGGSAAQTLVTLDGLTFNSAQNGQADLSMIPAAFVDDIVIEQGSVSALRGANAMTGAIDIGVALPSHPHLSAAADAGSFGLWRLQGSASTLWHDVRYGLAVEAYGSDCTFDYGTQIDGDAADLIRTNADARALSLMGRVESEVVTAMIIARSGRRGVPGPVIDGVATSRSARLEDGDVLTQLRWNVVRSDNEQWWIQAGGRYLDQHYVDPESRITGPTGIDVRYVTRDVTAAMHYRRDAEVLDHKVSADAGYVDLRGDMLQPDVGELVVRRRLGLSYAASYRGLQHVDIDASIRGDAYSDVGTALNGMIGARWSASETIAPYLNVGTGFRPPSFNELYFLNYGTSTLRPERSVTATVGAVMRPALWLGSPTWLGGLEWNVSAFASDITDLIVSVPANPVVISAQNVGSASSLGIESVLTWRPANWGKVEWTYTLQDVRDRTGRSGIDGTLIPYVPQEMIGVVASTNGATLFGRLEWTYTSHRFAQPGGNVSSMLAPYHLTNVQVGWHLPSNSFSSDLIARIDNVFNTDYEIVRGYPMPGMQFRLTVRAQW